jgi:hypothetical protein
MECFVKIRSLKKESGLRLLSPSERILQHSFQVLSSVAAGQESPEKTEVPFWQKKALLMETGLS